MGLVSPGGVHSHQDHIVALVRALCRRRLAGEHSTPFLTGATRHPGARRVSCTCSRAPLQALATRASPPCRAATTRWTATKRWDRVEKAYNAIAAGQGRKSRTADEAIAGSYRENIGDEFVVPAAIGDYAGMKDGDALVFSNFRADRAREISTALIDPEFDGFRRERIVKFSAAAGMTEYSGPLTRFNERAVPARRRLRDDRRSRIRARAEAT